MLKLFNRKTERDKEEDRKDEEEKKVQGSVICKQKKSPGELRLKKEIAELDLPSHA